LVTGLAQPAFPSSSLLQRGGEPARRLPDPRCAVLHLAPDIAEVLVVDDGSLDASRDLIGEVAAAHPKLQVLAEPHRGKAGR